MKPWTPNLTRRDRSTSLEKEGDLGLEQGKPELIGQDERIRNFWEQFWRRVGEGSGMFGSGKELVQNLIAVIGPIPQWICDSAVHQYVLYRASEASKTRERARREKLTKQGAGVHEKLGEVLRS